MTPDPDTGSLADLVLAAGLDLEMESMASPDLPATLEGLRRK